uniref:Uncharacterized protein n=1 Tax=Anguilla anguilla TaxID=7936 RepID=A0A0E9UN03_ANGAN
MGTAKNPVLRSTNGTGCFNAQTIQILLFCLMDPFYSNYCSPLDLPSLFPSMF